jgi:amino acid adenylation domain-containing protein
LLKAGLDVQTVRSHIAKLCDVETKEIEDIFPCTPLQEGLLALSVKRPGDYIAQFVFELKSTIDTNLFRGAWEELQKTTPILRTRIIDLAGQGLVQVIFNQPVQWPSKAVANSLTTYMQEDREINMDLGSSLVRVVLVDNREGRTEGKRFFVLTIHHALYDGWSLPILIQRLSQAYDGVVKLLCPPPFQGFVRHILNVDQEQATKFWEAQFEGFEAEIFPSLPSATYQPRADTSIVHRIQDLKWPETDVTASTVVRTAWAILASFYTGSKDVIFGVTSTGRQADVPGVDRITGPTIATVPVRVKLNQEHTLEQLLLQVQTQAVEMTMFEQTGLQRIRQFSTSAVRACEFQTLLVIQPAETDIVEQSNIFTKNKSEQENDIASVFATHLVTVEGTLETRGIYLRIGFDHSIIDKQQVHRMAIQLEEIIRLLCSLQNAKVRLTDIGSLSQEDLKEIWTWNAIVPDRVENVVHNMIAETTRRQPNAPAVSAWDGDWTYTELDDISTRLAYYLVGLGVEPDIIVPLCFEKSRWTPVAMLAVMKAGGASVVLDSCIPEKRLRNIIEQINPILILSSFKNQELAGRLTQRPIVIADNANFNTPSKVEIRVQPQLPVVQPWNKLYVVFTSGSTGTPKGVIITHSNFTSAIRHQQASLGFTSLSRVYDFAMYSFDVTWSNFLHTISAGGCLCIPSDFEAMNNITGSILSYSANFVDLTPSVASTLRPSEMRRLERILFSGESLTGHLATEWSDHTPINTYGPAECSVKATFAIMNKSKVGSTSIGKGVGLCTWIVNPSDHDCLVPLGTIGELLLEGPLVGAGYLGDPEKTIAAFIEDPKWLLRGAPGQPGRHGRLYKTGDLVRYSPDGSLTFLGRKDGQTKINGQRVELGDIEYHIRMSLPSGSEVQIVADVIIPYDSKKAILVAFIQITDTTNTNDTTDTTDITDITDMTTKNENKLQDDVNRLTIRLDNRLVTRVPAHMIPSFYIAVRSLPMTTTGKTDRRSLRAIGERMTLEELTRLNGTDRRLLTTSMERKLQQIWSTVLGIKTDRIGANDSFLRIGGDSIGAMRLVRIAREQGLHLTVADIFKQPRLRDMARIINELSEDNNQKIQPFSLLRAGLLDLQELCRQVAVFCDVNIEQIEDIFPCTPLQEGLLALSTKRPGDYVAQFVFELKSTIDVDLFRRAWQEVERTTPILRTRIVDLAEQGLMQVVLDQLAQWPPKADLNSLSICTQAEKQLSMDLGSPLVRVAIIEEDGTQNTRFFVLTIHHALYDGWSIPIILERLSQAYHSEVKPSRFPLFQNFIRYIIDIEKDQSAKFWNTQFDGLEPEIFPPLPSATYQPRSDNSIIHRIQDLTWPEKTDVTASTIFRTAWAILTMQYTGSDDVIFGVTVTGRQADVPVSTK